MNRIIHFVDENATERWGVWDGSERALPFELDIVNPQIRSVSDLGRPVRVASLLPPVVVPPPNVFGVGLNYRAHAAEGGREAPDKPLVFIKASTTVIGPGDPIVLPQSAPDEVDVEAELAVVIGRRARRVAVADALDCVLGFTCANDLTARDCQRRLDGQWARAKSFDTFCPLGPCLVSAHEFDPTSADITSTWSDRQMQRGHTGDMIFSCAELVSYLSHQFTLLPWTVICTGTPAGVGVARTPPMFIRPGDRITVSVAGIGELTNPVVAEDARSELTDS